jgi:hypothetical protein
MAVVYLAVFGVAYGIAHVAGAPLPWLIALGVTVASYAVLRAVWVWMVYQTARAERDAYMREQAHLGALRAWRR